MNQLFVELVFQHFAGAHMLVRHFFEIETHGDGFIA